MKRLIPFFVLASAVLMGAVLAGCGTQNSNPDNIPGAPATAGNTTTSVPNTNTATGAGASSTASTASFDDAANTWSRIEEARAELDAAIKAKKLDQVHEAASKIRDLVKTLPDKSAMLPEDKRKTLDSHVRNVGELAAMMDKSNDPNDMQSAQEHQTAMNESLDMMKGIYPAGAMRSSMHMPDMSSAGKGMSDDSMSNKGMPGKGMSGMGGMGGEMGGMGKPTDPGKMGGMGMMDKMTSGLSAMDKNEMKRTIDKVMAMPPAERKKALQKMSGMGKPTDPSKQAAPNGTPMPGGGMGGDM